MTSRASDFRHEPVLPEECLTWLQVRSNGTYVDCTIGGAGHSSLILAALGEGGRLIGIDKDDDALDATRPRLAGLLAEKASGATFTLVKSDFSRLDEALDSIGIDKVDGILADLGVSSFQLDEAGRGFGYMQDGPLDMRMDRNARLTAAMVVNTYPRAEIERILFEYGEERFSARIASAILEARAKAPFESTNALAETIRRAIPAAKRREGPHPAKRSFQAIRIEVNGELSALDRLLETAPTRLAPGGRLCVISFHSLEDRRVKEAFKRLEKPCVCPKDLPRCHCGKVSAGKVMTRQPIEATVTEQERNPRSRSAKLRVFEANDEQGAGANV
jgi:16S rRNA (cytosine1402-N4)-methyltransferase